MTGKRNWQPETALLMGIGNNPSRATRLIRTVDKSKWDQLVNDFDPRLREWFKVQGFSARPGQFAYASDNKGLPGDLWLGVSEPTTRADFAALAAQAPAGEYAIATSNDGKQGRLDYSEAILGWALGTYRFNPAGASHAAKTILHVVLESATISAVHRAASIRLTRDLVNLPAQDLGPTTLAVAAREVANFFSATTNEIVGKNLITEGFPAIHAVGRAAEQAPRLVEIRWGEPEWPSVTLIGKGVCFDTGGLNVKAMTGMRHMKRDMGGAAVILGLGALIMSECLPVRLRILLPIVENAISDNAMRPGDLIATRDGSTIEIENTDCEGRIILADAITAAIEENPDLLIDCATLTGSARTAFGGEIQALFTSNDILGKELQAAGLKTGDAVWQMPIWNGYRGRISGPTGDLLNMAPGGYAGAITAALFLEHFAHEAENWAHLDISAWNDAARPGHPVGGEATGLSAIYEYLRQHYAPN